ncbi:fluoride efflux transporter FluC [Paenisporosarcina sp. TG-14]|uniref:fluoride efflux transporter FluC n=1 Tax=Paenisporosarcina sp. TG-14 TaxID=1231057 RepID=UPI0002EB69DF|nr:CrcB family protein [Paenisporosarcina sp. TG-14]
MTLLAVAIGGCLGAVFRYIISLKIKGTRGIVVINWLGSFLMGFSLPIAMETSWLSMFWIVGFLGAFTTFSTFAVQFVENWIKGKQRKAISYALFILLGGFAFVSIGWWLGSLV